VSRLFQITATSLRRSGALVRLVSVALLALLIAGTVSTIVPIAVEARAPGIAIAEFDQPLLQTPAPEAEVLMYVPAGFEMELTGSASGTYVQVLAGGVLGWVDVNLIHAGQITTATTNAVTPITAEPDDSGQLLTIVPAGNTVILTGAQVDAYLAGSYEGVGGWLPEANLD
jgi:hypothetical protein